MSSRKRNRGSAVLWLMMIGTMGAALVGAAIFRMGQLRTIASGGLSQIDAEGVVRATLQIQGSNVADLMQSLSTDRYAMSEINALGTVALVNLLTRPPGSNDEWGSGGGAYEEVFDGNTLPSNPGSGVGHVQSQMYDFADVSSSKMVSDSERASDVFAKSQMSEWASGYAASPGNRSSSYEASDTSLSMGCRFNEFGNPITVNVRNTQTGLMADVLLKCMLAGVFQEAASPLLRAVVLEGTFAGVKLAASIVFTSSIRPAMLSGVGPGPDPRGTYHCQTGYCINGAGAPSLPETPELLVYGPGDRLLQDDALYDFGTVAYSSIPEVATFLVKNRGKANVEFNPTGARVRVTPGFELVSDIPNSQLLPLPNGRFALAPGRVAIFRVAIKTDTANNGNPCAGRFQVRSRNGMPVIRLRGQVSGERSVLVGSGTAISNPFGTSAGVPPGNEQIVAKLYNGNLIQTVNPNVTHGEMFAIFPTVDPFFDGYGGFSFETPGVLFFSDFQVSRRWFTQGFGTPALTWTKPNGTTALLDEWFAIKAFSHLKLGQVVPSVGGAPVPEQPGFYQLAIASDDGARMAVGSRDNMVVPSTGIHAMQFFCATKPIQLVDSNTLLPFELGYYQGPRVELGVILFWRRIDETNPLNAAALADPNFDWSEQTYNSSGDQARNFCSQGWYEETPRDATCMATSANYNSGGCTLRRHGWKPLDPGNFQLIPPVASPYTCTNGFT